MSRIGRAQVVLPKGVQVSFQNSVITVKGPKGTLHQPLPEGFEVSQNENNVSVKRPSDSKLHRAQHGLFRALLNNMVIGVSSGYQLTLELVGVGYKAEAKGQVLELSCGYSHNVAFIVPRELSVKTETKKGEAPKIFLSGIDKQLLGQVAAKIRSIRKPEPYKGKGIRLSNEVVRRKAGKSAGKGKK